MRKIQKPAFAVKSVLAECLETLKSDQNLRDRLSKMEDDFIKSEKDYELSASNGRLYTMPAKQNFTSVNGNEMIKLYERGMVQGNGRKIYDKLKLSAPNDICPLCGQYKVTTLDHYLPKSKFPIVCITPINLIPSCFECNKVKATQYPKCAEEQIFHPYFDDFENDRWLDARVIQPQVMNRSPIIEFFINPPTCWASVLENRVKFHFDIFKLNKLYVTYAAQELISIKHYVKLLFDSGGENSVRKYLSEQAASRQKVNINSWQTAIYHAVSVDDWFCRGGFLGF